MAKIKRLSVLIMLAGFSASLSKKNTLNLNQLKNINRFLFGRIERRGLKGRHTRGVCISRPLLKMVCFCPMATCLAISRLRSEH